MFNVTGGELLLILMLALIVLGPERLPDAARKIGRAVGQLRDLSGSFQREIRDAFDEPSAPVVKPGSRPQLTAIDGGGSGDPATPVAVAPVDGGEAQAAVDASAPAEAPEGAAPEPRPSPGAVDEAAGSGGGGDGEAADHEVTARDGRRAAT